MEFEINQAGLNKLQHDLERQFAAGVQVPLGGSEAEAVESVKDQLRKMGAAPNEAEVQRIVRDVRKGQ